MLHRGVRMRIFLKHSRTFQNSARLSEPLIRSRLPTDKVFIDYASRNEWFLPLRGRLISKREFPWFGGAMQQNSVILKIQGDGCINQI